MTPENVKIAVGDLYFYCTAIRPTASSDYQAWMFAANSIWADITMNWRADNGSLRHPLDAGRVLITRSDGTPNYVAESTWKELVRERGREKERVTAGINSLSTRAASAYK